VALAGEVNPLVKALRDNGIEVTAIHNHMLDDDPRAFFIHFWANDDAVKLARGPSRRSRCPFTWLRRAEVMPAREFVAALLAAFAIILSAAIPARAISPAAGPGLVLEQTLTLGMVEGRIDHLAVDVGRSRLFVAELGDDTVAVVDFTTGKVMHRIGGFHEPQGIGYSAASDTLYVSNAGDGRRAPVQGGRLVSCWRDRTGR